MCPISVWYRDNRRSLFQAKVKLTITLAITETCSRTLTGVANMPHLYFTFSNKPRVLMKWCVSSDPPLSTPFTYISLTTDDISVSLLPSSKQLEHQETWTPHSRRSGSWAGHVLRPGQRAGCRRSVWPTAGDFSTPLSLLGKFIPLTFPGKPLLVKFPQWVGVTKILTWTKSPSELNL